MALIIVGISGDLARRKLLPALRTLAQEGTMPFDRILGTSRRVVVVEGVDVRQVDPADTDAWRTLAAEIGTSGHFFYLAVPPGTTPAIAGALSAAGFGGSSLVLEKPFGFDGSSSAQEAREIATHFPAERVFRVDHYLCKGLTKMVAAQGRGASAVQIFASENLGMEGRADFYDKTGALRDFGNHALTLAAVALGGAPAADRLRALQSMKVQSAKRAQYDDYSKEVGHASGTETFFALELASGTTTVTLASGKGLATKSTEVFIDGKKFTGGTDRAYEKVFAAAARGDKDFFLTDEEIAEAWRLMDAARDLWGALEQYPRGAQLETLL